jgi:glycerol kinase
MATLQRLPRPWLNDVAVSILRDPVCMHACGVVGVPAHQVLLELLGGLSPAGGPRRGIVAVGIANQRETAVVWSRRSGRSLHNAIVWSDARTADICAAVERDFPGGAASVKEKTGLPVNPYFSGVARMH